MPQSNAETHITVPADITHGAAAGHDDNAIQNFFQGAYDALFPVQPGTHMAEKAGAAIANEPAVLEIPPLETTSKNENPLTDALSFAGGLTSGAIAGGLTGSLLAEIGITGAAVALGPEILVGATVAAAVGLGLKAYGDMCASELKQ